MKPRHVAVAVCCCLCILADLARADDDAQDAARLHEGARIGRIQILVDDVFEQEDPLSAPYRLANALHIATHVKTIADQLLFHTGDVYDPRTLEESARLLREQRYLGDASIEPLRYNDDNSVDVMVRVRDVWTMSPGISFGRQGGANSASVEFEDTNFLGLGKQISAERSSDVDRQAWRFGYRDPHLFGSWWRLGVAYGDLSDGSEKSLSLSRPFYSLDSRWSFTAAADDATSTRSQYSLGEIVDQFSMRERRFEIGGGWSDGLRDGWTRRYLAGIRYELRDFAPLESSVAAVPDRRALNYPWFGIELIEDQYRKTRNLDQIGRVEDLYLGRSARLEAGYASTALGSTRDALMLSGSAQAGFEPAPDRYLVYKSTFHGRVEDGELHDALLELGGRYYLRQSPRRVLFAAATASFAAALDPEEQLLLGGDSGLRGYPLRYQAGTTRALVTLEERFYTRWQPLKLFNVGAAVFFDAGRTWGSDPYAQPSLGWLRDVGIGLRLGSVRSGLGNVLHIDIACPLDGGDDIDSVQFLIQTRRSF
ncbi:MAG TPA: hypothetical protein PKE27_09900 [Povalibacter sp.]|uniref:hypothetical protein n=1 Tax=Povalibacter sp. TaxID=1962978 RepID=UPI002C9DCECF|nr:hypothetical protein [Povalibacter sp.]HMN44876.1 hypothetical protein [Povalibacter sp.]